MTSRYRTSGKSASTGFDRNSGIWRGIIERIDGANVYVRIPRLTGESVVGPIVAASRDVMTVGDRVMLGFLEGRVEDPVILGPVVTDAVTAPGPTVFVQSNEPAGDDGDIWFQSVAEEALNPGFFIQSGEPVGGDGDIWFEVA